MSWFHVWLFLHITAAIIAFGPTFAFPIIGAVSRKHPMHAGFALLVSEVLEMRLVIPFALSMPISGLGMAYTQQIQWQHNVWLIAAVSVYACAMFTALVLQAPVVHKLVHMTNPAPGSGVPAPAPAGPGAAVAGPPPEMARLLKRMQMQGMLLTVFLMTIIVLMIWKPGGNI
jgi:predicted integral membrane protein DUF2269